MPRCLVSLGSNIGDTAASLGAAEAALRTLANRGSLRVSARHRTDPIGGPGGQEAFLNAVASFNCDRSPEEVLTELQQIENATERRREQRWDARTLDLDLLLFDERIVERTDLRVPHPRMTFRPFVLEPAAEIATDWRHPECDATLGELLSTLQGGEDGIRLIDDDGEVRSWIETTHAHRVTIDTQDEANEARRPKLTIDASPHGSLTGPAKGPCGPRLALADCPPEHWQDEVAAALECVWPTASC